MVTEPNIPQPPQDPPPQEEDPRAEFERRYKEEKALEAQRDKERQYQLFRLEKDFKLDPKAVEEWKARHPLGVELVWLKEKPFIYRALTLGEYLAIVEKETEVNGLRRRVVASALLWPTIEERDLVAGLAGMTTTLAEAILRTSGFEDVVALPV